MFMMNAKFRKLLFGTSLPQEYICVAKENLSNQFRVYLLTKNGFIDITDEHILLGYCPVIIGLSTAKNDSLSDLLDSKNEIVFMFGESAEEIIAKVALKKIEIITFESICFFLFEGIKGSHNFLSIIYQLTNNIKYKIQAEKKKNIYLKGNLYQQVKIAYSIPRNISLITLGNKSLFNIFPTDLNGRIDDNYFVISLRKTSKANQQVIEQRKLLLSEISAESCIEAYSYGINHMRELQPIRNFSFNKELSESIKLPLPKNVLQYFELEFVQQLVLGIHNLIFFTIIGSMKIGASNTLAHIHRDYAQWRINNNLQSEFLFR